MADFEIAFKELMRHEGDYSNDVDDNGGETRFGISKRSYPNVDIRNLTLEKAKEIYRQAYWQKNHYGDIKDQRIATAVFLLAVNSGSVTANKMLQTTLNACFSQTVVTDGIMGAETLQTLITQFGNFNYLYCQLCLNIIKHYKDICYANKTQTKYLLGWINRVV